MKRKQDRVSKIKDVRQRAVAEVIGEVCDLFCDALATQDPAGRLLAGVKAGGGPDGARWRHRNIQRKYALGCVGALLSDLGVMLKDQHGYADKGTTEIAELRLVHPVTMLECTALFRALVADGSRFGVTIAAEYGRILAKVRRSVEARATE